MVTYRTIHVSIVPRSQRLQETPYSEPKKLPSHNEEQNINKYPSLTSTSWTDPTSSFNQQTLSTTQYPRSSRKSIDLLFAIDLPQIPSTRQPK